MAINSAKKVTFTITPDLLKFYDYNLNYVLEPGDFVIMIGPNSRDVKKKPITIFCLSALSSRNRRG
ncbi:MAG: fibronectin type III-like domain-contianing protein [Prevotella sp.]|nr:fibronectin type III-like domain-contianing protein [Prevotella sp.]